MVDGVLGYFSDGSGGGDSGAISDSQKPAAINMTSGVQVADGQWHRVDLEVVGQALRLSVDGVQAGYELELSAAHDFLDPDVEAFLLGQGGE